MNLFDTLMLKAKKDELAHFYIVESSLPSDASFKALYEFTHKFICDYYHNIEGHKQTVTQLMNHPDVFVLGNLPESEDQETQAYSVLEAEALSRFFEFKPVQGKRKFAVITEGHRLTTIIANKCLKLFEEPQGLSTIFLLNPRRQKLLDTIHSRALHLRLPVSSSSPSPSEWQDFLHRVKSMSLSQFLEAFNKGEKDVHFWTEELIRWESLEFDHSQAKNALTDWVKNLQEMETFHQPSATKWTLFYALLKEHVLPRASH